MPAHAKLQLSLLGPQAVIRQFVADHNVSVGNWWPRQLLDGAPILPGPRSDGSWSMALPSDPDPVVHPVDPMRAWFEGSVWDEDWVDDEHMSGRYPQLTFTVVRGDRVWNADRDLSVRTYRAGKLLVADTFRCAPTTQALLFLPEADAVIPIGEGQTRSIRCGQLGWLVRGRFARWGHGGEFIVVNHATDTAANRGAFEEMVRRASGTVNQSRLPQEVLTLERPAADQGRRVAVFDLTWDSKVHLIAALSRWRASSIFFFQRFLWDLADAQLDEVTLYRYAVDLAGTASGAQALLAALPELAGSDAAALSLVEVGFYGEEDADENEDDENEGDENEGDSGGCGGAHPDSDTGPTPEEISNVSGLAELAARMVWLKAGRPGPLPRVESGAVTPAAGQVSAPGSHLASTVPAAGDWAELERVVADHLNSAAVGTGRMVTITLDAPGTRYVQFVCSGGKDITAMAVGPEYIDAGPDFFTPQRGAALSGLGFAQGMFGDENFGQVYDNDQWQRAAGDAVAVFRDVLDVLPGAVTVHVG